MAPAATHARSFLDAVDPDAAALDLLDSALRSAAPDRASWRTLRIVEQWGFEQLDRLGVQPAEALERDEVLDVLAAVRLVTTTRPARLRRLSVPRFRHRVAALLDTLEPEFVPELLQETRRRMAVDPAFAAALADARDGIAPVRRRAERLLREVRDSVGDEFEGDPDLPVVLQRAADDEAFEVAVAVFVIVLVVVAVATWIASEDPAKN
jgi:hypothetical protein